MTGNLVAFPVAAWAIPVLWLLAALFFVLFLVRRRRGRSAWMLLVAAGIVVLATLAWMVTGAYSRAETQAGQRALSDRSAQTVLAANQQVPTESQAVFNIVVNRCQACHSDHATMMAFAAFGLSLNTMADVEANALPIYQQVVEFQQMPMGNATHMTDAERATIAHWYASKQHQDR